MIDCNGRTFLSRINSRKNIFISFLMIFTGFVMLSFVYQTSIAESGSLLDKLFFYLNIFDLFISELLILFILSEIFLFNNIFSRMIIYLLTFIFLFVFTIQVISISIGGEYVSRLAIDNFDHIYLLFNSKNLLLLTAYLFIIFIYFYFLEKQNKKINRNYNLLLSYIMLLLFFNILNNNNWFYKDYNEYDNRFIKYEVVSDVGPIFSFANVIISQKKISNLISETFSQEELNELAQFNFHYDPQSNYPIVK